MKSQGKLCFLIWGPPGSVWRVLWLCLYPENLQANMNCHCNGKTQAVVHKHINPSRLSLFLSLAVFSAHRLSSRSSPYHQHNAVCFSSSCRGKVLLPLHITCTYFNLLCKREGERTRRGMTEGGKGACPPPRVTIYVITLIYIKPGDKALPVQRSPPSPRLQTWIKILHLQLDFLPRLLLTSLPVA